MKLSSILALMFAAAAIGNTLAFLFLGLPFDRIGGLIIGGFVVAAAFFTSPELVGGWIRSALDHLPSFGRKTE